MSSKHRQPDAADDLDDLDDVLDEFNAGGPSVSKSEGSTSAGAGSSAAASTSQAQAPNADQASKGQGGEGDDADDEDLLSEEFAKQFAQSMQALMQGLGPDVQQAAGGSGAPEAESSGKMNEEELMKQFERMLFAGEQTPSASTRAGGAASTTGSRPPASGNFQDTIAATMAKLKQSDASASSSTSNTNEQEALMMQMLSALAGGEGEGAAGLQDLLKGMGDGEGGDGEAGLAAMLENMMSELMSKEVLYEPLKEMRDKYPEYLASPKARALSSDDRQRYEKQSGIVREIVALFENPEWDDSLTAKPADGSSADAAQPAASSSKRDQKKAEQQERQRKVQELMNEMQDCGAPPDEIVGDLPPGLEGMSSEDCTVM